MHPNIHAVSQCFKSSFAAVQRRFWVQWIRLWSSGMAWSLWSNPPLSFDFNIRKMCIWLVVLICFNMFYCNMFLSCPNMWIALTTWQTWMVQFLWNHQPASTSYRFAVETSALTNQPPGGLAWGAPCWMWSSRCSNPLLTRWSLATQRPATNVGTKRERWGNQMLKTGHGEKMFRSFKKGVVLLFRIVSTKNFSCGCIWCSSKNGYVSSKKTEILLAWHHNFQPGWTWRWRRSYGGNTTTATWTRLTSWFGRWLWDLRRGKTPSGQVAMWHRTLQLETW